MEITLSVSGMTCGHCKSAVQDALKNLSGVTSVEVHLDSGKVDVVYDDALVSKEDMEEAIEEQGYDVVN
ncbi:copper-binding protein [Halalkalibacillus sediminis]|uniref:Copper chaperone CopZ n=1 Tax=Halalkalibacillus sediminis TaxID=2018042 RepID=A0A2I0QUN8_9BACI|nr:copper chaperone CopZ [Halalkalibacillus sediminis]PKR78062.1 copper-binding protein [Halalkalibacillus sediminis]